MPQQLERLFGGAGGVGAQLDEHVCVLATQEALEMEVAALVQEGCQSLTLLDGLAETAEVNEVVDADRTRGANEDVEPAVRGELEEAVEVGESGCRAVEGPAGDSEVLHHG